MGWAALRLRMRCDARCLYFPPGPHISSQTGLANVARCHSFLILYGPSSHPGFLGLGTLNLPSSLPRGACREVHFRHTITTLNIRYHTASYNHTNPSCKIFPAPTVLRCFPHPHFVIVVALHCICYLCVRTFFTLLYSNPSRIHSFPPSALRPVALLETTDLPVALRLLCTGVDESCQTLDDLAAVHSFACYRAPSSLLPPSSCRCRSVVTLRVLTAY